MAFITADQHRSRPSFLQSLAASLTDRLAERRAYLQTRRELDALSDRDLVDLGLTRHDIEAVARGLARQA